MAVNTSLPVGPDCRVEASVRVSPRWAATGAYAHFASVLAGHFQSSTVLPAGSWGIFSTEPMPPQMRLPTGMMPRAPMIGPGSWMPQAALDTSQDGLKRPPAA